jgi:hypothetical protein
MKTLQDENFLVELLASPPPPLPVRKRTWFDLSGSESSEVDNSRWYRYFLDPDEDHNLGTLFLDKLLELSKCPFQMKQFTVRTEVKTQEGRIDILISGTGDDKSKYIIIENKIYHHLTNNLDEYLGFFTGDVQKFGILLTLKRVPEVSRNQFASILHIELIEAVINRTKNLEMPNEPRVFFEHFTDNIRNLNRYFTMNKNVTYFVEQPDLVNRANVCRVEAERYIATQLELAACNLELPLEQKDNHRLRSFRLSDYRNEITLSVIFDKLLTADQELRIVVGLASHNLKRVDDLDEKFKSEVENQGFRLHYHGNTTWHNYVTKIYCLTKEDWSQLGSFVEKRIREEFIPIATKIGSYLNDTKEALARTESA